MKAMALASGLAVEDSQSSSARRGSSAFARSRACRAQAHTSARSLRARAARARPLGLPATPLEAAGVRREHAAEPCALMARRGEWRAGTRVSRDVASERAPVPSFPGALDHAARARGTEGRPCPSSRRARRRLPVRRRSAAEAADVAPGALRLDDQRLARRVDGARC